MRAAILQSCRTGAIRDGEQIPPVRSLARQYDLSINLASEVIRGLIAEGVLHTRQGAGTYAGSLRPAGMGAFLYLLPEDVTFAFAASGYLGVVQRGFELRIAQMGGSCIALEARRAREYVKSGDLPPLAGIFAIDAVTACDPTFSPDIPRAWFGDPVAGQPEDGDYVHFDDIDGGRQAARYLLSLDHSKIAFLGLHAVAEVGAFRWSAEREIGWRDAMLHQAPDALLRAFHPGKPPHEYVRDRQQNVDGTEQILAAREAAAAIPPLVQNGDVTAVIAANTFAARALFEVLESHSVPVDLWPAVVCFDNFDNLDNHVVSAMHLPWDDMGKAGAGLLWERKTGTLHGPGQPRLVPMQLIPRLTCRPEWRNASNLISPRSEGQKRRSPRLAVAAPK